MVGAQDFLAAPALNEFAHFAIGVVVVFIAIVLIRGGWFPIGAVLLAGFVAFVSIKEFYIDETTSCFVSLCGYGQSANGASVDAAFYLFGGVAGASTGVFFPSPYAIGFASVSVGVVGLMLLAGLI